MKKKIKVLTIGNVIELLTLMLYHRLRKVIVKIQKGGRLINRV